MTGERQTGADTRIRAAIDRLLSGDIPEGLKCDVKSLCKLAAVPRATLYRAYPHLKAEFEQRRAGEQDAGRQPDPRLSQMNRLKAEIIELRARLGRKDDEITELTAFRAVALSRLTAQHEEIATLRAQAHASRNAKIRTLPTR